MTKACSVYLTAPATVRTAVSLSSNSSALSVPATVYVNVGASTAGFASTIAAVNTVQTATVTGTLSGVHVCYVFNLTPVAVPTLSVSASTVAFSTTSINTKATQTFTLTSTGTSAVTVSAISATGTGFSVSGITTPATLNPGQTATATVTFAPTTAGTATGQIAITSNSSTGASAAVNLSGIAINPGGMTYYLAPRANGGSDANSGLAPNVPWLTPNHPVNCGDVIIAEASTAYVADNFNSGYWGKVSCPSANNVAWLQCATFDGCKISSTRYGIYVDQSFWGVSGWEVSVLAPGTGFCFGAAPEYASPAQVHHVIFANNVANGCQMGGIVSFNMTSSTSVDYLTIIGNIIYNGAQSTAHCYSGISVYQPIQSDSAPGTHIFIAGNIAYGNIDPSACDGNLPTDGEGIILDTFDGSQGLTTAPYAAQALIENNILIGNGGRGFEVQNNVAGSQHASIYSRNNTIWGNNLDTHQVDKLCSEFLILTAYGTQASSNIVASNAASACGGFPLYGFWTYEGNNTDVVTNNVTYGSNNQDVFSWDSLTFAYDTITSTNQNPSFRNAVIPAAGPNCTGTASAPACMANVIAGFTPTNSAATAYGYQIPSTTATYDALFPQWLCTVNLPAGLTTRGCTQ